MLGQFLKSFCIFDPQGAQICDGYVEQVPNLWRVGAFVAGGIDVSVEIHDPNPALGRTLLSQYLGSDGTLASAESKTVVYSRGQTERSRRGNVPSVT